MLNNTNPYFPQNNFPPTNMISGQILQANGADSIKNARFAPNSSALIAHQTLPIVYRVVADSLGNVTIDAFDISIHKSEEEVKAESMENRLTSLERHLLEIEEMLKHEPVYSA